jgi:hypothetical protein
MRRSCLLLQVVISLLGLLFATHPMKATTPTPPPTEVPSPDSNNQSLTQADLEVITGNVQRPNGMIWFNSKLYIVCAGDWTIYEVDTETGSTAAYIYGIRNGHTLYAEMDTNDQLRLWIPDFDVDTMFSVSQVGTPSPIGRNLAGPWGIAALDPEYFLVTNFGSNDLVRVSREGQITPILGELRSPTGIAIDRNNIYVANSGSTRRAIEWFDKSLLAVEEGALIPTIETQPLVSGLQNVTGLVAAADGYLYFAYALGTRGVIGRVNPEVCVANGGCTNDEVEMILVTQLPAPLAGLTITPDMKLYVHTMFRPEIYWVQLPSDAVEATATEESSY